MSIACPIRPVIRIKFKVTGITKMKTGIVRFYNRMKGWGFIVPDDLSNDIFVHYTRIVGRKHLREGQKVSYQPGAWNGKPVAENVQVLDDVPDAPPNSLTQADALAMLGSPKPKLNGGA